MLLYSTIWLPAKITSRWHVDGGVCMFFRTNFVATFPMRHQIITPYSASGPYFNDFSGLLIRSPHVNALAALFLSSNVALSF